MAGPGKLDARACHESGAQAPERRAEPARALAASRRDPGGRRGNGVRPCHQWARHRRGRLFGRGSRCHSAARWGDQRGFVGRNTRRGFHRHDQRRGWRRTGGPRTRRRDDERWIPAHRRWGLLGGRLLDLSWNAHPLRRDGILRGRLHDVPRCTALVQDVRLVSARLCELRGLTSPVLRMQGRTDRDDDGTRLRFVRADGRQRVLRRWSCVVRQRALCGHRPAEPLPVPQRSPRLPRRHASVHPVRWMSDLRRAGERLPAGHDQHADLQKRNPLQSGGGPVHGPVTDRKDPRVLVLNTQSANSD
jgi:hypothetical protein